MHTSASKIFLLITRSILLAIYSAFFLVQLFYNTGSDSILSASRNFYYNMQTGKQKKLTADSMHHNNTKSNIRLNKRFQPALVPDMAYTGEELAVKYINRDHSGKPKDYLLISFILAASLRGPPPVS